MKKLTDAEILAEVEVLIADYRYARAAPALLEHNTYHALKAIAADIRARTAVKIDETQKELAAALDALEQSKTGLGFEDTQLRDVALKTRAYWPTIKFALKTLNRKIESAEESAKRTGVVR